MGERVQASKEADSTHHQRESGDHSAACRRPAGRKPGPAPDGTSFGRQLAGVASRCFPDMNRWLDALPDPRRQDMCVYSGPHLWWQMILTFLLRHGTRNAFDGDRNSGELPENLLRLCAEEWDEDRLGTRRTVTCTGNTTHHASRIPVDAVAGIPLLMVRRLIQMRMLDDARLLGRWRLVVIDGTLQDRGRDTPGKLARYRYVVEAKLVGPEGTMFPLMTEFVNVRDPILEKEDCELNAFRRLAKRLKAEFPRQALCLALDGLYPVHSVFDLCEQYEWMFIATLREGRQPIAWDEAVQTMMMSPSHVSQGMRYGEDGCVQQTLRWTNQIPFGKHTFQVLFAGEISSSAATLWAWVTNFPLAHNTVHAIANQGGRKRNAIENVFNVEKNGGFGLEHAFCANDTASQNYHLIMQVAYIFAQLLINGILRRFTSACRKLTDIKITEILRYSLTYVRIDPLQPPPRQQIRFIPSS